MAIAKQKKVAAPNIISPQEEKLMVTKVILLLIAIILLNWAISHSLSMMSSISKVLGMEQYIAIGGLSAILIIVLLISLFFWNQKLVWYAIVFGNALVSFGLLFGVFALLTTMFKDTTQAEAVTLFKDSAIIWITSIFAYAIWYWLMDQGGWRARMLHEGKKPDFLFAQESSNIQGWQDWQPGLTDYVFLAFCMHTAFGPADTAVLSHRAKIMVISQLVLSVTIMVVLVSRVFSIT